MTLDLALDGFSFVKTKQRYEIHIYVRILNSIVCMLFHSFGFKAQY